MAVGIVRAWVWPGPGGGRGQGRAGAGGGTGFDQKALGTIAGEEKPLTRYRVA